MIRLLSDRDNLFSSIISTITTSMVGFFETAAFAADCKLWKLYIAMLAG